MKILVTGGCGFIGSHVIETLQKDGHKILVVDDCSTGKIGNIEHLLSDNMRVKMVKVDILDYFVLLDVFRKFRPDIVIHLAAQAAISTSVEFPVGDATINILGTLNVISAANDVCAQRLVFSSTSAVYKYTSWKIKESFELAPDSPYGVSKLSAERYIQVLFPNSTILRFGNVFGERQVPIGENQVIPRAIRHFEYGDDFKVHGDGEQKRDFIHVRDVAEAVGYSMFAPRGIYNIASGRKISVNDVLGLLDEIYEVPGYRWTHTERDDPRHSVCMDISRAWKMMAWKPKIKFLDGLRRTVEWWKGIDRDEIR